MNVIRLSLPNWLRDALITLTGGVGVGLLVLIVNQLNLAPRFSLLLVGVLLVAVLVLAVRDLKRLLLVAVVLDAATNLDVHLTCTTQYFVSSCGFNISLTTIALVGLYTLWLIESRRERAEGVMRRSRIGKIGKLGAAFFVVSLVSLGAARNVELSLYLVWAYIQLLALYYYLANNIRDDRDLVFVLMMVAVGLGVQVLVMQLEAVGVIQPDSVLRFQGRLTGTFKSPNSAGAYLAQTILILLPALFLRLPGWQKFGLGAVILAALYSLIGTESRGAWSAILVGFAVILVGGVLKRWINLRAILLAGLVVIVVALFLSAPILTRLTTDDRGAASARAPLADIAWNMIRANPVAGVGWNNFGVVLRDYVENDQFGAWLNLVHNAWLLIWSETGTVSFVLYVMFWLMLMWQAIRLIRFGTRLSSAMALGILASLVTASVHMLVEIFATRTLSQIVWMEAGLLMAMLQIQFMREPAPLLTTARKG